MKFKPNPFCRFILAFPVITWFAIAQSLQAAALTWDTTSGDGSTITAGGGTWDLTSSNLGWNNAGANPNLAWTQTSITSPLHTATFAGTDTGTKSILVGADIAATSLTFSNSGYTLSSAESKTIRLNGVLSVASGKSATIGSNVIVTRTATAALDITGGGTIFLQGAGAKISGNSNNLAINSGTTLDVGNGGVFSGPSQIVVGSSGSGGNLLVNGGSVSAGSTGTTGSSAQNIVLHNLTTAGTSQLTINDGSVINLGTGRASAGESGLRIGTTSSTTAAVTATVNLNGGSLTVARVYEGNTGSGLDSTFNFNGGTLRVTTGAGNAASFMTGLNNAFVKEGGATIDTNGVATTIAQVLKHGGADATDGGLVKKGSGTLTLTGDNTYNGKTDVQAGTLTLGRAGGSIWDTAALEVSGGILDVANAETVGAVTLSSGTISGASALTGTNYTLKSGSVSSELAGAGIVLTKDTAGTATLGGTQTYTGATNIDDGTLNVTGSLASAIHVGATGALSGEGSTAGNVVFTAGSTLVFDPTTTGANQYFRSFGNIDTTAGATTKIKVGLSSAIASGSSIVVMEGGSLTTNGGGDFQLLSRGTLSTTSTQVLFDYIAGNLVWKGGNETNPTFWDVNTTAGNFSLEGIDDFFLEGDNVTFDDTASSHTVAIQGASIAAGSVTFDNSVNAYHVTGVISGNGTLVKSGGNTLTMVGANTYTGGTTISAGTLQLGDGILPGSITGGVINNAALVVNAGASNLTISGDISGSGSVAQNGSGTVILTGSNSYGSTLISAGTLQIGSGGTVGTLGGGAVINHATLAFQRSDALTVSNDISGSGSLVKSGMSSLTLAGSNSYDGLTTLSSGGLVAAANNALGSTHGSTIVAGGSSLGFTGGFNYSTAEKIIGSGVGTTVASTGVFTAVQRGFVQSVSGDNTFAGDIEINAAGISRIGAQDGASLTLTGAITMGSGVTGVTLLFRTGSNDDFVTLSNNGNHWDQDTVIFSGAGSAGGVRLGVDNALPTAVSVVAGGNSTGLGTTLDLNGHNQTLNGLGSSNGRLQISNSSATPSTLTLTPTTSKSTQPGMAVNLTTIDDGTGAGKVALVKDGAFTQTLHGSNSYSGTTTIKAGTLALTSTGTINNTSNLIVGDTGSSGAVLDVTAKSTFTIGSTQTLSGIGTVNIGAGKTVSIEGIHAAGNSVGTQSVTGNLSYLSGSIFEWDLASGTLGARGSDYDGVNVTGNLGGSGAIFKVVLGTGSFSDTFWNTTREWTGIFTASNGFDMSTVFSSIQWWEGASNVTVDDATAPGHFSFTDSGTTLTWTAVPEPTGALVGLLVTAGLLRRRRGRID